MCSNFFIKNDNMQQKINLKNNEKINVFIVANQDKDLDKTINLTLLNNNEVNIYCLVLATRNNKTININIDHKGNQSISNIYVKALANNKANIKVNCVSLCNKKTSKNIINQVIDGLIFDNESSIQALPCLDININDIEAKHTVNIGQIDPEIIFYLNTKGLSELESYQFLIDNFIDKLKPYLTANKINIKKDISKLIRSHYE